MTAMSYIIGVEKKIACNRLPKSSWGMVSPAGDDCSPENAVSVRLDAKVLAR
jgi:hypothetical protein